MEEEVFGLGLDGARTFDWASVPGHLIPLFFPCVVYDGLALPFQGERRFYLGAVDDDLFLSTGQWEYLPENDYFGEEVMNGPLGFNPLLTVPSFIRRLW